MMDRTEFIKQFQTIELAAEEFSKRPKFDKAWVEGIESIDEDGVTLVMEFSHCGCCANETEQHVMSWDWIDDIASRQDTILRERKEAAEAARIAAEERQRAQAEAKRQSDLRQLEQLRRKYPEATA